MVKPTNNESLAIEPALLQALSEGLPLVSRPYAAIADRTGLTEAQVLETLRRLQDNGLVKRTGVIVRHRELGYTANGMVVWDIPDARVQDIGQCLATFPFVTLCYRRPRRRPDWPYNLFTMVHGRSREQVIIQVSTMVSKCGLNNISHKILFSRRRFKQRGARYAPRTNGSSRVRQAGKS